MRFAAISSGHLRRKVVKNKTTCVNLDYQFSKENGFVLYIIFVIEQMHNEKIIEFTP